jgi:hypothetical protein
MHDKAVVSRTRTRGVLVRLLLAVLLPSVCACTTTQDIAARPGVQSIDDEPLEVFRTVQVEAQTHSDRVTSLSVDRDERLLLTGSRDKTARLWSLIDGAPRGVLRPAIGEGELGRIDAVALSPDGRIAAVGGRSAGPTQNAVLVFDTRSLRQIARLEPQGAASGGDTVAHIRFDEGDHLVVRYASQQTLRFDLRGGTQTPARSSLEAPRSPTAPRLILNSGQSVLADEAGQIIVEDGARQVWRVAPAFLDVTCLAVSSDASQVRILAPGGAKTFSAAQMSWVKAPNQAGACRRPDVALRFPGGGVLKTSNGAISRLAPDGRAAWTAVSNHRVKLASLSGDGSTVVASFGDGTLRWLDAATGAERLALYLHAKSGWIAWTPDGFFDHSEEAWNFAGWHVNRGPGREAEFVKLAQLYDVAYRPDLIRLAYAGRASAAEAMRLGDALDPRTRLARGLPPRVTLTAQPSADSRTAVIDAHIEERGGGVGKLLYRINGVVVAVDRPAAGQAPPRSSARLQARRSLALRNGPNQIELVVLDAADQLESAAVAVVAEGRGDAKQGKLWALVVGINRYSDPAMRLNFARPDAEAIAAILPRAGASTFAAAQVVTLLDARATRANIAEAIATMAQGMAETDTLVLYLSGHGVNLQGRYHFVTHDVTGPTPAQVEALGLSQDALQALLAKAPAGRAIVVLDTCFSGRAISLDESNMMIRNADRRLARATGRSVLAAATDQQQALEGYRGHGVLTYVLLQGLDGSAAPADKPITVGALAEYAQEHVPVISAKQFGAEQHPVFSIVGQDVVLARGEMRP